jgi:hypothetical protein
MAVKIGRCTIPNLSRIATIDMKQVFSPDNENVYSGEIVSLNDIESDIQE